MPRPAVLLPREEDGAELSRDAAVTLERVVKCGDTLLVLGAPWDRPDYAYQVARLRSRYGMRLAVMIHDLIPILHPEWCDAGIIRAFGGWNGSVLPLADQIFSNSRATARDVEEWAEREGVRIARPVVTLPLGTGFSGEAMAEGGDAAGLTPHVLALRQQPYVLFVSTIEARKNHLLAFRAWRQLLRDLPREQVPRLVFAGRVGWLVADLMQQLENANWLDGHVTLVRDPTDAELRGLYEGCWFTLFPSLYEGWGLPVTESLSFGKPCVASSRTAVPEAGGPYCLYHDPDSVTEAVALLKRVIAEPELIAERARRLRHEFRPTPWSAAAELILRTLGQPGQHSPNNARVDPVEMRL
jgi:glycosyltransferase involved in cell wall biosynthesis